MKNIRLHVALLAFSLPLFAQQGAINSADKNYDKFAYVDAIKTYERVADKGFKNADMLQKLGNSYYFNNDFEKAAKWYGELLALTQEVDAEYYYRYAQSLKALKQYDKANQMMDSFAAKNASDARGKMYGSQKDYLAQIEKNSNRYKIEDAGVNSNVSDYGSAVYNGRLIFATARDTGNFAKRINKWDGGYTTNFYSAKINEDGSLGAAERWRTKAKTRFHEAVATFSPDGKTMFFSRSNFVDGKRGRNEKRQTLVKIYKSELKDSVWQDAIDFPFNSDSYNTGHPALTADGKWLYFSSDMPGGLGNSDIWRATVSADGSLGTPENLGPIINSPGRDAFPFISSAGELYFSTDGRPGLGGLDIYVSKPEKDGSFKQVYNIGAPANSAADDFGFQINFDTKKGFLSSNREGGKGSDDIYKFIEEKVLETKKTETALEGTVVDAVSGAVLPNATVTLSDENMKVIKTVKTDATGKYELGTVEGGKKYYVKAEADGYVTKEQPLIASKDKEKTIVPIELTKVSQPVKVGDNLADVFGIKLIYFDFDKDDITSEAEVDLAKIMVVLEQYPAMELDIQSHADSRGTAKYNMKLSEKRAAATKNWLLAKGVAKNRLTGKGYGESELTNKCADGVDCSEEEHAANRRSLFIIKAL